MIKLKSKNETRSYFRSTSAKAKSARSNLNSSWANKNNLTQINPPSEQNKDQITNVVNGFRLSQLVGMNNEEMGKFKRNSAKFTNKSIQQLYEENLHLKRDNNRLLEQVAQLRGRFEAKARTNSERGKQLDLEFQKQLYWGGSKTHLISGIKHQYQKLQKLYSDQSKELTELKKALIQTKYPQCQVQAEVLEIQNKKLSEKLMKIMQSSMKAASNNGGNKRAIQILLMEANDKLAQSQKNLKMTKHQLQVCQQELRQKQKKTLFLQKLLIEKDNSQYHAHRKIKKLEKTINDLKIANEQLKEYHRQLQKNYKAQKDVIQKNNEIQQNHIRQDMKKQTQQLKAKIQFLLEDKKELQTNINKLKMTNSMIGGGGSSIRIAGERKSSISPNKDNMLKNQSFNNQQSKVSAHIKLTQLPNQQTFQGYESEIESNTSKKQRVMLTADKKHSIHSKKMRKVQHSEVVQIGELVRYRMIASNLSAQQMKKLFERSKNLLDTDDEWKDQYLNMKQLIQILKNAPFKLEHQMAYSLSRYLIEDCNEEYVYCDEKNENKREIVKSIMKTLIGDYSTIDEATSQQIVQFKSKYLSNFESALKTYYPSGKVPKKKFVEVLLSMGTDMKEKSIQAIVAKIVDKSANLLELAYEALESL